MFAALLSVTSTAAAESAEVERLVADGIQLRVQGREAEALEAFRAAVTLAPDSQRAQGHLALALHALGHWIESERIMLRVLDSSSDDWVNRHLRELRDSLSEVQAHLAWLAVEVPTACELWIDGNHVTSLPIHGELRVLAQKSTVSVRFPRGAVVERVMQIPAGQHVRWSFWEPPPPVPVPLVSRPATTVHTAAAEPGSARHDWGKAALGIGSAGVAAGICLGVSAIVQRNARDRECVNGACTANGIANDARGRAYAELANISWVVGVAGLGVGAILVW